VRLTTGLASANEEAFREFHRLYFDRLYYFLLIVCRGSHDEAQEALQQTLIRVVRHARAFETEETFWCWLKVVARSAARDAEENNSGIPPCLNGSRPGVGCVPRLSRQATSR
jgi:DNA-directed RNA polymerase specialized sigma24 family protein